MVEDTEAVAEIHAVVGQRHGLEGSRVEAHVGETSEALLRNGQRVGACVDAMDPADAPRDQRSPPPTPAAGIEAHGIARQTVPRKDREVLRKHPLQLCARNAALVEALPFPTEIIGGCPIKIWRIALHRCRLRRGAEPADVSGGNRLCRLVEDDPLDGVANISPVEHIGDVEDRQHHEPTRAGRPAELFGFGESSPLVRDQGPPEGPGQAQRGSTHSPAILATAPRSRWSCSRFYD